MRQQHYKFFTTTEKTWQAMFEAISSATESIYLEMFIFTDNMLKYNFLQLLQEKARNGFRVRIILDPFGSMHFSNEAIRGLKASGAELFFFPDSLFHVNHRKVLVVDEKVAFIGGVNFSMRYVDWDDLAVEVKGKLVKYIIRSFAKVYVECGGNDPILLVHHEASVLNKTHNWLIEHFPTRKNFGLKTAYQKHINGATTSVIIVTPYLIPNLWLVRALKSAVERGVKVEVLIPITTNVSLGNWVVLLANYVNHFYMRKLSEFGVIFYLRTKMNHSKLMIVDHKEAILGSQNLDVFSFERHYEIGIFFEDRNAVKELSDMTEIWKSESVLFNYKAYRPNLFDHIVSVIIRVFSQIAYWLRG